jgi:hypothetical protein
MPITVSGNLLSSHDTFDSPIEASGGIYSESSSFNKVITLSAVKSSWINSRVNSDITSQAKSFFSTPTLTFYNTQITGNIKFTKTKGVVVLTGNSKISGSVTNADIKYK